MVDGEPFLPGDGDADGAAVVVPHQDEETGQGEHVLAERGPGGEGPTGEDGGHLGGLGGPAHGPQEVELQAGERLYFWVHLYDSAPDRPNLVIEAP